MKILLCFLLSCSISNICFTQVNSTTTGDNSPIAFAKKVSIQYGIQSDIVLAIIHVYEQSGLTESEHKLEITALFKKYSTLSKNIDSLSKSNQQFLEISSNTEIINALNFDLFLRTTGKNSPVIYSPNGEIKIWYGIPSNAVRVMWNTLEKKQLDIESLRKAFKELVDKYNELKQQVDELAKNPGFEIRLKQVKQLIDNGHLEEADQELATTDKESTVQTAAIKNLHAKVLEALYKYKEATSSYRLAVELDSTNLIYVINYANNLNNIGFHSEAIPLYQKVIDKTTNDSILVLAYSDMAMNYKNMKEYNQSLKYSYKAIPICENLYGIYNPILSDLYKNIGGIFQLTGSYDTARSFYLLSLRSDSLSGGSDNLKVAQDYYRLGSLYSEIGKADSAILFFNKDLNIDTSINGEMYPSVAATYQTLGKTWITKNYHQAIRYLQKSIYIDSSLFSVNNPYTEEDYNVLGIIYDDIRSFDLALICYQKALKIALQFSETSPQVTSLYNNIGVIYREKQDYKSSFFYARKGISIAKIHEREDIDLAFKYDNLGMTYRDAGLIDSGLIFQNKALQIELSKLGERNQNTAITYENIGYSYLLKRNFETTIYYYNKALQIFISLDSLSTNVANEYNNIGYAYHKKLDFLQAQFFYEKSVSLFIKIFGVDNVNTKTAINNLRLAKEHKTLK